MNEKVISFIGDLIRSVTYLAPALIIFYRQGKRDQQFDESRKDLNALGEEVSIMKKSQENGISEVKEKIGSIELSLTKMAVSMEFISKQIEELKAK